MRNFWRNIRDILSRQHDAFSLTPHAQTRPHPIANHVKVQRPPYDWDKDEAPGGPRVVPPRPRKPRRS